MKKNNLIKYTTPNGDIYYTWMYGLDLYTFYTDDINEVRTAIDEIRRESH